MICSGVRLLENSLNLTMSMNTIDWHDEYRIRLRLHPCDDRPGHDCEEEVLAALLCPLRLDLAFVVPRTSFTNITRSDTLRSVMTMTLHTTRCASSVGLQRTVLGHMSLDLADLFVVEYARGGPPARIRWLTQSTMPSADASMIPSLELCTIPASALCFPVR
jgi:hypothetical protein